MDCRQVTIIWHILLSGRWQGVGPPVMVVRARRGVSASWQESSVRAHEHSAGLRTGRAEQRRSVLASGRYSPWGSSLSLWLRQCLRIYALKDSRTTRWEPPPLLAPSVRQLCVVVCSL